MSIPTIEDVAAGWIATQENWWAWEAMDEACRKEPELAWTLILSVLSRSRSDKVIENLGAGPLEDLLAKHGNKLIERVETHAALDPQFRLCLSHTWKNAMPEDVWQRVCRATNRDPSNVHGTKAE